MGNAKKCLKRFLNLQKDVSSDTCYPILAMGNLVSETQYLKLATPCKILLPFATIVRLAIFTTLRIPCLVPNLVNPN